VKPDGIGVPADKLIDAQPVNRWLAANALLFPLMKIVSYSNRRCRFAARSAAVNLRFDLAIILLFLVAACTTTSRGRDARTMMSHGRVPATPERKSYGTLASTVKRGR
jgi:hypothetical protein